jgi:hypothetical protein
MKALKKAMNWKMLFTLFLLNTMCLMVLAQDGGGSSGNSVPEKVNIKVDTGDAWYSNPIVWVIGAAVFILLLVALMRGGGSRGTSSGDRVTYSKTVERDTDV